MIINIKTRYGSHDCIFEKDVEKGGFIVTAKNLKGVITWGKNLLEAKKMAKEAVELCIECVVEECIRHWRTIKKSKSFSVVFQK